MNYLLNKCKIYQEGQFVQASILIKEGKIFSIAPLFSKNEEEGATLLEFNNCVIIPGLIDVHVHLREPGFLCKESIATGTLAGAHGGYTDVCAMPNLNPTPDSLINLQPQLDGIKKDGVINVYPYGSITKGQMGEQLSNMEEIADKVIAFSDDGRGVQKDEMMESAMIKAKLLGKIIVAHCEDNSLLNGGYIHDGKYAKMHNHKGICSASEWKQIERDLKLVEKTGCSYHVCHISTKESVELIRQAKKKGLDVTCETAPHYLILDENDLQEDGRFKMNPPLREREDRIALIEGIKDGTIDMIATDHAPHTKEEKSKGLEKSLMGIVGLETAFPLLYTKFVKTGEITFEKLIELMSLNPSKRFNIMSGIKEGNPANLTVFNLEESYTINPDKFLSKGRSTPFANERVSGVCKLTMVNGKIAWQEN